MSEFIIMSNLNKNPKSNEGTIGVCTVVGSMIEQGPEREKSCKKGRIIICKIYFANFGNDTICQ